MYLRNVLNIVMKMAAKRQVAGAAAKRRKRIYRKWRREKAKHQHQALNENMAWRGGVWRSKKREIIIGNNEHVKRRSGNLGSETHQ